MVDVEFDHPLFLDLSNVNARALLALLGFAPAPAQGPILNRPIFDSESESTPDYLTGSRSILECRLAITRATSAFDARAPKLTFEDETVYGAPREVNGVVVLRPIRVMLTGLDAEGLRSRLERFARLVDYLAEQGATHVHWS